MNKYTRLLLVVLSFSLLIVALPAHATSEGSTYNVRDIYMPETLIVTPPAVVQIVDSADVMAKLSSEIRPQLAWFQLNNQAKIILGQSTATLQEGFAACVDKVIPVLVIPNLDVARTVTEAVKDKVYDLFLASSDPEVIKKLHADAIPYCRLAYIAIGSDAKQIAADALSCYANTVVLSECSRETAEYLQQRFLTVMLNPNDTDSELSVRAAVDCGANLVVLSDYQKAYDMYANAPRVSYVRKAYIVGHRCMVSKAPENTVEGLHEAFENGADAVEIDVWRTEDDRIVCFHNNYLKGSTTVEADEPEKLINSYTYDQLLAFTLNPKGEYTDCKIPTLDAMLEALKGYPDKMLVIEIKDYKEIATYIKTLIEQYGVADQCVFIAFGKNQLDLHRNEMPVIGGSLLDGGYEVNGPTLGQVDRAMKLLSGSSASYSPSQAINPETIEQLNCRGISCNLWTAQSLSNMTDMAYHGAQFITTDLVEEESWVRMYYARMGSDNIFGKYVPPVQEPDHDFSVLVTILISTVSVAIIAGVVTIVCIKRKKK